MRNDSEKFVAVEYILLAEDDEDDYEIFDEAFNETNLNLRLIHVKDGVELMDFLSIENTPLPEMIFLDLNMPYKNGFECLHELKSNERLKEIPVIIYTTSNNPADIEKSKLAKAHLYITKPGDFSKLKKIVHKVLVTNFVKNLPIANNDNRFFVFSE